MRAHALDDFPGESSRRAGGADQYVGLDRVDGVDELERRVIVRIGKVVRHQIGPALDDEAVDVDEPEAMPRLFETEALVTSADTIRSAMPVAAEPAPRNMIRRSRNGR